METGNQDQNQNTNMNNEQIDPTAQQQPSDNNQQHDNTNGSTDERIIDGQKLFDFNDLGDVPKLIELLKNPALMPFTAKIVILEDDSRVILNTQLDFVPSFANLIQFGSY